LLTSAVTVCPSVLTIITFSGYNFNSGIAIVESLSPPLNAEAKPVANAYPIAVPFSPSNALPIALEIVSAIAVSIPVASDNAYFTLAGSTVPLVLISSPSKEKVNPSYSNS